MAFQTISDPTNEERELPWLNEWIDSSPDSMHTEPYEVESIKVTPKGYIVSTEYFNAWLWKKTTMGETLIELLRSSVQTDSYPVLMLKVDTKLKNKFSLGCDDEVSCNYKWSGESNIFILHPQKNLPLDLPHQSEFESKGEAVQGKPRKQSSVPRSA